MDVFNILRLDFEDSCYETHPHLLKCNLNHYHAELPSSGRSEKPMGLHCRSLVLSGVGPRSEQVEILSSGPL